MVEGPTAHKFSYDIEKRLRGQEVRNVYTRSRKVYIDINSLIGERLTDSEAYGKNIIIHFGKYSIRLHLMLYGTIHIQGLDEKLRKPFERVRLKIDFDRDTLIVYNAPIVEIGYRDVLMRNIKMNYGPDPLREDWDPYEAFKRLRNIRGITISKALLDQRYISGLGNILRNEILYRCGIHPEKKTEELSDDEIRHIINVATNLSKEWLELKIEGKRLKPLLKVYNKYRGICPRCGSKIIFYVQEDVGRKTFICPSCQQL